MIGDRERALDRRVKNQRREIATLLSQRDQARLEVAELRERGRILLRVLRRNRMGRHDGQHDPEECTACALALAGRPAADEGKLRGGRR